MISLDTASKLKQAGLAWVPSLYDFFAIPERNLDDRLYVISDLLVTIEQLQDMQIVSFQGASEWALDYLLVADTVWIPREDQLRHALEAALLLEGKSEVQLISGMSGSRCTIKWRGTRLTFRAANVDEAYAQTLLHVLLSNQQPSSRTDVISGSNDLQSDRSSDDTNLE